MEFWDLKYTRYYSKVLGCRIDVFCNPKGVVNSEGFDLSGKWTLKIGDEDSFLFFCIAEIKELLNYIVEKIK